MSKSVAGFVLGVSVMFALAAFTWSTDMLRLVFALIGIVAWFVVSAWACFAVTGR